jgi:hypothetical protein
MKRVGPSGASTKPLRGRLTMIGGSALLLVSLFLSNPSSVEARCHAIEITWYSPTGIAGCEVYGVGWASHYPGPGVAVNACEWPWTDCAPIRITVLATGASLTVTPTMFCDCYTGVHSGPLRERLVDLDPSALAALGLDPSLGLFKVRVEPARGTSGGAGPSGSSPIELLPNTAMSAPR